LNGVAQDLGIPGESGATGINNLNQIVGWYRFGGFGSFRHGFVWQNGTYITLDSPTGYSGSYSLNTINNSGVIPSSGYVYIGGQWIELTDPWTNWLVEVWGINDLGIMVGFLGPQGIIVAPAGYSKTTYDPETNGIIGIVNSIYPSPESSSGLSSMSATRPASIPESSTVPEPSTVSVSIGMIAIAATAKLRKALRVPGKSK
jgi:probable HAF family extracellular repeat protein